MQQILFGDFDALDAAAHLEKIKGKSIEPNPAALYELIQVLYKTWPKKRVIIENQIRKLLTELGLEPG